MSIEKTLDALSNFQRLKIIDKIMETDNEGVIVNVLTEMLGLKQPTVTHHLNKMVDAGLLEMIPDGHFHIYKINTTGLSKVVIYLDSIISKIELAELRKEQE